MRHFVSETTLAGLIASFASGCGAPPPEPGGTTAAESAPLPGEEPLETESIGDEEVTGLPPERLAPPKAEPGPKTERTPAETRGPCAWSRAWGDPDAPKPLVAGVGAVKNPTKIAESPIRLPARDPLPRGDIIVELVIAPDGTVSEARVVRSTEPPWPSADRAVEEAVRAWRYEPVTVDGTPIAVCQTAIVSP